MIRGGLRPSPFRVRHGPKKNAKKTAILFAYSNIVCIFAIPNNNKQRTTMEEKTLYRIIKPVVDAWNQGRDESLKLSCKYEEDYIEIVPKEDNPHLPGALLTDIAMLAVVYDFAYGVHLNINGTPQILL